MIDEKIALREMIGFAAEGPMAPEIEQRAVPRPASTGPSGPSGRRESPFALPRQRKSQQAAKRDRNR